MKCASEVDCSIHRVPTQTHAKGSASEAKFLKVWIMKGEELEQGGGLRQAAAAREQKVHVGAAIMPDYLNAHYDPYSEVLNRGKHEHDR